MNNVNTIALSDTNIQAPVRMARVYPPKLAKAIIAVTKEVGRISKDGINTYQKYKYPSWENIIDRLSPLLAEHGIIIVQSERSRNLIEDNPQGSTLAIIYTFTLVNAEGEEWPPIEWTALARLRDGKGVTDDKAAAKCHTQAEKYFCIKQFKIRTNDRIDSDEGAEGEGPAPAPAGGKSYMGAPAAGQPARPAQSGSPVPPPQVDPKLTIKITPPEHLGHFAERYAAALQKVQTLAEFQAMMDANYVNLTKVMTSKEDAAEPFRAMLGKATAEARARTKPVPKSPATIVNPEAFVKDAVKRLDEAGTIEAVELVFVRDIEPLLDQLLPPDQQFLLQRFRHRKEALTPN
jgi:ERF superfamily